MQHATSYRVRLTGGQEFGPARLEQVVQWAREGRVPRDAVLVREDGATAGVMAVPQIAAVFSAPPAAPGPMPQSESGDETLAALIPFRNKPALIGYYAAIVGTLLAIVLPGFAMVLGVSSKASGGGGSMIVVGGFMCLLGIAVPLSAIVLGVKGRRLAKESPRAHGRVHAWIAILGGAFGTLLAVLFSVLFVTMAVAKP